MSKPYARLRNLAVKLGYEFHRQSKGDHERWRHPITGKKVTLPTAGKRHPIAIKNIEAEIRRRAR